MYLSYNLDHRPVVIIAGIVMSALYMSLWFLFSKF